MLLPKTMVVEQLRARGDDDGAERADRELGEKVDTEATPACSPSSTSTPPSWPTGSTAKAPAVG